MNKLGFGYLRLPNADANDPNSVDFAAVCDLADRFIELGGNYFDTAYIYLKGNSEIAVRETLVKRYPREKIRIADKLPASKARSPEDCRRIFDEQLQRCGVDYFDVYLLHALNGRSYEISRKGGGFEFLKQLKESGQAKAIGFSYHDGPELLDRILTEHPEVEYVQLQINYLDWESVTVQSRRCYEVAARHGKRVIVMEPVKGGSLANLPEEAAEGLRALDEKASMASWAIRFAQSLDAVEIVLSGMNTIEQIEDNMRDVQPLNEGEKAALSKAADIVRSSTAVACTGCAYCVEGCPQRIPIPKYFALYNEYARMPKDQWKMDYVYADLRGKFAPASDCIGCGACEASCPQKLNIIESLKKVAEVFEGKKA